MGYTTGRLDLATTSNRGAGEGVERDPRPRPEAADVATEFEAPRDLNCGDEFAAFRPHRRRRGFALRLSSRAATRQHLAMRGSWGLLAR